MRSLTLLFALSTLALFGCDDRYDVKENLRDVQPDWGSGGWVTIGEEPLHDFYNVQRAIQWGNRSLAIRRTRASLERASEAIGALSPLRQEELQPRIDDLADRVDDLEHLDDWRLEAEALNHAILALDREVLPARS